MVYSVVETFEKDTLMVTATPSSWIIDNILWWPPQRKVNEYRKKCTAPSNTWKKIIIKRVIRDNIGNIKNIFKKSYSSH